jgi:ribosome-associated toxin RatA of RatAB toxin-antitoxin module
MNVRRSALVPHPVERMFDLIEAAEDYPAFLPWCAGATILSRDETLVTAELTFAFHGVRFQLATRNPKRRPDYMAIRLERGPFRRFEGEWRLTALSAEACKIEFVLQYEFDTPLLGMLAGSVFNRITSTLVDAFVERAESVHGSARDSPDLSQGSAMSEAPWTTELFESIDGKNTPRFLSFLTVDAQFRFANNPPAIGAAAIGAAVDGFLASIRASRHEIHNVWATTGHVICQGTVTYTRHDGSSLALPFVNVFAMSGNLIQDYLIYIDATPLYAHGA